jgi:hypothetical protein
MSHQTERRPATAKEIRLFESIKGSLPSGERLQVFISIENGVRVRAFFLEPATVH